MEFFRVKTSQQVKDILRSIPPGDFEKVSLDEALHRVLAQDIIASSDFPPFARSAMDGYAVGARDSFGASETTPGLFEVIGEVRMGETPTVHVGPGQAARIGTGGFLPAGADAVVMVEYTQIIDESTIEVFRAVAPGDHVVQQGEDIGSDERLLEHGHRLRAQDVGALAALGITTLEVYRRPIVAIISTGDELVPPHALPRGGQIRDTNTYTLSSLAKEAGAISLPLGIAHDSLQALIPKLRTGLTQADIVVISAGSSIGARDLTVNTITSLPDSEVLLHGVAVSPGKPTILARVGSKYVWGLPGHAVSAMIIFLTLVVPSLLKMGGYREWERPNPWSLRAKVSRNIPSAQGREDYIRVKLVYEGKELVAVPLFGKSGSISTMVKGDGLLKIDMNAEGIEAGDVVEVWPF